MISPREAEISRVRPPEPLPPRLAPRRPHPQELRDPGRTAALDHHGDRDGEEDQRPQRRPALHAGAFHQERGQGGGGRRHEGGGLAQVLVVIGAGVDAPPGVDEAAVAEVDTGR